MERNHQRRTDVPVDEWAPAVIIDDLSVGERRMFRQYDKRIALFRTANDI